MQGFISKNKINYIFYHLNFHFNIHDELKNKFVFLKSPSDINKYQNKIIFLQSDSPIVFDDIFFIDSIPVLFPLSKEKIFYSFDNNNLIFEHDIIKSAFYLLTGFQEYKSNKLDIYDRFLYESSIQKKLNIVRSPTVNYYFDIIIKAISEFCSINKINFQKRQIFKSWGFMLTHDIDFIDTYTFNSFLYKIKEFIGLSPSPYTRKKLFGLLGIHFFNWINFINKKNPAWSFGFLRRIGEKT